MAPPRRVNLLTQYGNATTRATPTPDALPDPALVFHVHDALGCTWRTMCEALGVSHDTLQRWRDGTHPIPPAKRRRLVALRAITVSDRLLVVTLDRTHLTPIRRRQ